MIADTAAFCSQCGTAQKRKCPSCGGEVGEHDVFCGICGSRVNLAGVKPPVPEIPVIAQPVVHKPDESDQAASNSSYSSAKTIKVTREPQIVCIANTYRVVINENELGNIGVGQSITYSTMNEIATIDIICTTPMINARLRAKIKLENAPHFIFKVEWPGKIIGSVLGGTVLEQTTNF